MYYFLINIYIVTAKKNDHKIYRDTVASTHQTSLNTTTSTSNTGLKKPLDQLKKNKFKASVCTLYPGFAFFCPSDPNLQKTQCFCSAASTLWFDSQFSPEAQFSSAAAEEAFVCHVYNAEDWNSFLNISRLVWKQRSKFMVSHDTASPEQKGLRVLAQDPCSGRLVGGAL